MIAGAVIAGAIIGGEREYRASPAGLRTHILVALSCCLLMLSAVHQMEWLTDTPTEVVRIDPVRMAHGVLTGIGFLCGGVIFREGLNVRGLTTAASLWMTATLGILFGVGFYELAIFGGVATFLVLAAVTWTERHAPQRRIAHITLDYRAGTSIASAEVIALLGEHGLKAITVEQRAPVAHPASPPSPQAMARNVPMRWRRRSARTIASPPSTSGRSRDEGWGRNGSGHARWPRPSGRARL